GADATVVEYLTTELLDTEPEDRQRFLEHTSVLERFSAPLCDAVLGRTASAVLLSALAQSNGFVVALDRRREWYSYHPLFQATLPSRLARHDPARPVEIHLRASEWYESTGDPPAALDQALLSCDERRVAVLLSRHLDVLCRTTPAPTMRRWLAA